MKKENGSTIFVLLDLVKQNDIFINDKEVYMQVVLKTKGICFSKVKGDKNEAISKAANRKVDRLVNYILWIRTIRIILLILHKLVLICH